MRPEINVPNVHQVKVFTGIIYQSNFYDYFFLEKFYKNAFFCTQNLTKKSASALLVYCWIYDANIALTKFHFHCREQGYNYNKRKKAIGQYFLLQS